MMKAERRMTMKFLSICKMTDAVALCPPTAMRQMLEATVAWMDAQKKAGKILEAYSIPGGRTAVICEHPSADDAAQTIASIPIGAFMNCETYALADIGATMKVHIESCKQAEQLLKK
jgi:hypothetical protein